VTPPRRLHPVASRRGHTVRLTPFSAVTVSAETVCATVPPRVHPVSCPGCAFDGGGPETPVTSEPTAAWQRGMRPVGL
jgi:hypothetical protein